MHPLLDDLRSAELEAALAHLPPPPARLLEIGAGSGWQASLLAAHGYDVVAVDAEPHGSDARYPVLPIDGTTLPFADDAFDVAFSSNVLEHVRDLPALLDEIDRVLAPAGRSVHVIPTPTWRVLTMATFYASFGRRLRAWRAGRASAEPAGGTPAPSVGRSQLRRALVEAPHGEFRSPLVEVWQYRAAAWRRRLRRHAGVVHDVPAGVVYTGYGLLPRLSMRARRRLARAIGSSCRVYVVERPSV